MAVTRSRVDGVQEMPRSIRRYGELVARYAVPMALTRTAYDAREELRRTLPTVFDRPTPYTLNATYVKPATRTEPAAWVGFREFAGKGTPAPKYLLPQVEGGRRPVKRFERALAAVGVLPSGLSAVPGEEADIDAFGNMRRGQIVRILSQLRAFGEMGYTANATGSARSRAKRRRTGYFAAPQGNREGLPPGVYKRDGADARPVIVFVTRPTYRVRFPFHETVRRVAAERFPARLREALAHVRTRVARRRA